MTPDRQAQTAKAQQLIDLGRYTEAEQLLQPSISRQADSATLTLLARARSGRNDHTGSLAAATSALALAPDNEWACRLASIASSGVGDREASVAYAHAAVQTAPYLAVTHARLAVALAEAKLDLRAASRSAAEAVRLDPDLIDAHLAVGEVAAARRRLRAAKAAYRRALAIDPASYEAHNDLARVDTLSRNMFNPFGLARAATGFQRAVTIAPHEQIGARNLGVVLSAFLYRTEFFVLVCAFIGSRIAGGTNVPRWGLTVPAALLVFPVGYAAFFMRSITPEMRRHLKGALSVELRLPTAVAIGLSAALLIVGSTAFSIAAVAFPASMLVALAGAAISWFGARRAARRRP